MTVKRTFSLPDDVSAALDQAAAGNASAYVAETIAARLDREDYLRRLHELWGPLPEDALAWARERLGVSESAAS